MGVCSFGYESGCLLPLLSKMDRGSSAYSAAIFDAAFLRIEAGR